MSQEIQIPKNKQILITGKHKNKLQKYNFQKNRNLNQRNLKGEVQKYKKTQIYPIEKKKFKFEKYRYTYYRNTYYRNTDIQITEVHKYKLNTYRNTIDFFYLLVNMNHG